jgi:hypothetical protein
MVVPFDSPNVGLLNIQIKLKQNKKVCDQISSNKCTEFEHTLKAPSKGNHMFNKPALGVMGLSMTSGSVMQNCIP